MDNFGEGMIQNLLFLTIDYSAAGSWIIFAAKRKSNNTCILYVLPGHSSCLVGVSDDYVMLSVFRCQLTYQGQVVTNAEARFNKSLRPRKPEGSLGRTAQDVHLDSHTAPELCYERVVVVRFI